MGDLDPVMQAMRAQLQAQVDFHAAGLAGSGSGILPGMAAFGGGLGSSGFAGGSFCGSNVGAMGSTAVGANSFTTSVDQVGPCAMGAMQPLRPMGANHVGQLAHTRPPMMEQFRPTSSEEQVLRQRADAEEAEKLRCHLHKKSKDKCKFCKKWQDFVSKGKLDKAAVLQKLTSGVVPRRDGNFDDSRILEIANTKTFGLPPLLQSHIVESQHFKSLLASDTVDEVVQEIHSFADGIEPYVSNSNTVPSAMFCCLYRLFTLGIDARALQRLIDYADNPFVRCLGFLFVRFGLDPSQYWNWLGEYVLDEAEFKPSKDNEAVTTIGEFVETLLNEERLFMIVLPRLPLATKRQLEAHLAQVPQFRKRSQANQRMLSLYRRKNTSVEVCLEDNGWVPARTLWLDESVPSRLKVRVRYEGGHDASVNMGRVILADGYGGSEIGSSHRSRSPDWARWKGKSQAQLLDEKRSLDRERAVCSSGKEYARKPVGFKVACALPREMGAASHRLLEDETFVPGRRPDKRRSPSPLQPEAKRQQTAEHQAQMQQLFEKYVMQKPVDPSGQNQANSLNRIDGPEVMRFG